MNREPVSSTIWLLVAQCAPLKRICSWGSHSRDAAPVHVEFPADVGKQAVVAVHFDGARGSQQRMGVRFGPRAQQQPVRSRQHAGRMQDAGMANAWSFRVQGLLHHKRSIVRLAYHPDTCMIPDEIKFKFSSKSCEGSVIPWT